MADLPVFLQNEQSATVILAREKASVAAIAPDLDVNEGGYIHDALAPTAIELAIAAQWAQQVLARGFAATTFGAYLDLRAEERGITRLPAVAAKGTVTFTGTPAAVIPAGTRLSTASTSSVVAIAFTTDAEVTIGAGGTVNAAVTAEVAGTSGNVAAGKITFLSAPIAGVTSVTNAAPTTGGLAVEIDAALLARYLQRVRNPSSSGNKADYINWAMECAGVGGVSVVPLKGGAGTVSVAIIGADKAPALPALVAAVQAYIDPDPGMGEGRAPIGATVTVEAATAVVITVSATLTIAAGYDAASVKAAAQAAIESYIKSLAFTADNDVRVTRIGNAIGDTAGVQDYSLLLVNGGAANVVIGDQEVAVPGVITLT
jgi:uncharacterized phage protein gp47/JayE